MSSNRESVEAIRAVINGMFDAFEKGEVGTIEELLDPECTVWDVFTPQLIRGRAEQRAFHEADQRQKATRGELELEVGEPLIDVWKVTAVARYVVDFEYAPPNAVSGRVRVTDVLRRGSDGRWLIVHHHEGLAPEGGDGTPQYRPE